MNSVSIELEKIVNCACKLAANRKFKKGSEADKFLRLENPKTPEDYGLNCNLLKAMCEITGRDYDEMMREVNGTAEQMQSQTKLLASQAALQQCREIEKILK